MHSKFNITAPDQGLAAALQQKIDQKTKPLGALGQLEQRRQQDRPDPAASRPRIQSAAPAGFRRRPRRGEGRRLGLSAGRDLADGRELPRRRRRDQRFRAAERHASGDHRCRRRARFRQAQRADRRQGGARHRQLHRRAGDDGRTMRPRHRARGGDQPQSRRQRLQCRRLRRNGHRQHGRRLAAHPLPDRHAARRLRRARHRAGRCRAGAQAGAARTGADALPQRAAATTSR